MNRRERRIARKTACNNAGHRYFAGYFAGTATVPKDLADYLKSKGLL